FGNPDGDGVGTVAGREAFFVAGIHSVRSRLPAERAGLPAERSQASGSIEFQRNSHRGSRSARNIAPRLAPGSPDSLRVLGPDMPVVSAVRIEKSGAGESVAGLAGVGCSRDESGEAHREGPAHVGPTGQLEMVVGNFVAV